MSTGAQIYLVSACTSGEEFVSAFRRYVDRNGVIFVPLAEPLPAGRRGRFAVTLVDGGVMLEGQAEVVSSARTPSVVHGRVGMTIKFLTPDDDSRKLLGELEKARLALKPAAPSVAPRPAQLPSDVRPKPPTPGGRVDSVNALAECVVLGDVAALSRDSEPAVPGASVGKPLSGPVPTVPSTRQPSGPISTVGKGSTETLLGGMPAITPALAGPPRPGTPSRPPGMPPIRPPGSTNPPPLGAKASGNVPAIPERPKQASIPPPVPAIPAPIGHQGSGGVGKATSMGLPALDRRPAPIDMTQTMRGPAPGVNLSQPAKIDMSQTMRGTRPAAPLGIAPPPPVVEEPSEKTDLSTAPMAPASQEDSRKIGRSTSIGVAISSSGGFQLPALVEDTRDTQEISAITEIPEMDEPTPPPAKPAPVVEEPSGDWTMMPTDDGPRFEPRVKEIPKGPPTGDWSIALDPSREDGWSEPSKIEKRPPGELPVGPPVSAVSSEKPLDSTERAAPKSVDEGPKIQIDPTLIEPLAPMPNLDASGSVPSIQGDVPVSMPMPMPMSLANQQLGVAETVPSLQALTPATMQQMQGMPVAAQTMMPYDPATPMGGMRGDITDANTGFFRDSGAVPHLEHRDSYTAGAMAVQKKKQKVIIIAVAAAALLLITIIALLVTGKKKPKTPEHAPTVKVEANPPPTPPPTPTPPPPTPPTHTEQVVTPPTETPAPVDAAPAAQEVAVTPTPPDETPAPPPPPTDCKVVVNTSPSGAEISIGDKVLENTPATLTLPCDEEVSLTLKRAKFQTYTTKPFKPTAEKQKSFKISLARTTFSVKVASTPPGASIYLGTKSLGITPAVIKVPQFDTSTLKITKDGYQPETQTVTPKNNNLAINIALKKVAKGPPPKGAPAKATVAPAKKK